MATGIRVAVCHGNQLLADCLCLALNRADGYGCVLIPPLSAVEDVPDCDVLLLDVTLPPATTTGTIEFARRLNADCRVLLLVPQQESARILEFTRLGAQGCILDLSDVDELLRAVSAIARGESYCSRHAANALFVQAGSAAWHVGGAGPASGIRLTVREREVLELIAWEKLGNKQIARRLSISLYTVKNHVHSIIEKLGVAGRSEAAVHALRFSLLGMQRQLAPSVTRSADVEPVARSLS